MVVEAKSITTRMPPRDWHLRTRDFLDVKRYPEMRISADRVGPGDGEDQRLSGTFEIHGVERPIELAAHTHETDDGLILHLQGALDRHDFGIRYLALRVDRRTGDPSDVKLALEPTS